MAYAADIDFYDRLIGQSDFEHRIAARGTTSAALAFPANGVKPKRIDRFRGKSATQKLKTDRAPATIVARPKYAMRGAHLFQRQIAPRTEQLRAVVCSHKSESSKIQAPTSREIPNFKKSTFTINGARLLNLGIWGYWRLWLSFVDYQPDGLDRDCAER